VNGSLFEPTKKNEEEINLEVCTVIGHRNDLSGLNGPG
jgi:hypothetical protein